MNAKERKQYQEAISHLRAVVFAAAYLRANQFDNPPPMEIELLSPTHESPMEIENVIHAAGKFLHQLDCDNANRPSNQ